MFQLHSTSDVCAVRTSAYPHLAKRINGYTPTVDGLQFPAVAAGVPQGRSGPDGAWRRCGERIAISCAQSLSPEIH